MLVYDRNDVSKGIDINKTIGSRECIICHHWYFLKTDFRYEMWGMRCLSWYDTKIHEFNNFAIVTVGVNEGMIRFGVMNKSHVVSSIKSTDLSEKKWITLKK